MQLLVVTRVARARKSRRLVCFFIRVLPSNILYHCSKQRDGNIGPDLLLL